MLSEVLSRVDLIIAVEGSRKISKENLDFLFEKYELSQEDREKVNQYCRDKGILIFSESSAPKLESPAVKKESSADSEGISEKLSKGEEQEPKKKGFFAKLFGK